MFFFANEGNHAGTGIVDKELSFTVLGVFGKDEGPMERYRIDTIDTNSECFEVVYIEPGKGLMYDNKDGTKEPQWFFHIEDKVKDRDVLFQSIENYETIFQSKEFSDYYRQLWKDDETPPPVDDGEKSNSYEITSELVLRRALEWPQFGEQIIVQGATPSDISIGDVFKVEGSTLKVQVTSPRKPCGMLDKRNNVPFGKKGVRVFTASKGLAGWFTRVLVGGEIRDGMTFVRVSHPHPKWTLENISKAVFGGEGDVRDLGMVRAGWGRSEQDLQELLSMEALGDYEWKKDLRKVYEKRQEERGSGLGYWYDVRSFTEMVSEMFDGYCKATCSCVEGFDDLFCAEFADTPSLVSYQKIISV